MKVICCATQNHVGFENLKTSIQNKNGWEFYPLFCNDAKNVIDTLKTFPDQKEWIIMCFSVYVLCLRSSIGCDTLLEAVGKEIVTSSNELFAGRVESIIQYLCNKDHTPVFLDTESLFFYQDQKEIEYEIQDTEAGCSLQFANKILSPYFIQFNDMILSNPWTKFGQEQQLFSVSAHYRKIGSKTNGSQLITSFSPQQDEFANVACTERVICICFLFLLFFGFLWLLLT